MLLIGRGADPAVTQAGPNGTSFFRSQLWAEKSRQDGADVS
jgi:hypothetical protein